MGYLASDQSAAEKWMREAAQVAGRALCRNAKCGAVIVSVGAIIGEGYNAPPLDSNEHRMCGTDGPGKPRYDQTCCMHAEWRAVMDALRKNPAKLAGSTLYFTRVDENGGIVKSGRPYCTHCSRLALDAGIARFALWHDAGIAEYPTDVYNKLSYEY